MKKKKNERNIEHLNQNEKIDDRKIFDEGKNKTKQNKKQNKTIKEQKKKRKRKIKTII